MIRSIIGSLLVLIITFSVISICQSIGRKVKLDITDQKLYTLSDGTKSILGKLNQKLKVKLYFAKTAALKGPDQIKYYNNYYEFVKALLEEYVDNSNGMIDLEIIDPRPYSDEEAAALRFGIQRFPITEEESFFFGLGLQTPFGVEKSIPFFSPDRQNFVEYDISYLIDTAITKDKRKIGVLSSIPVMGDDVTGYMAQMMRMQGQTPRPAWTIVEQLKQKYEVTTVAADTNDISGIDILMVIHPKNLGEETLFAIDQFVLGGGRTIVCIDPHCIADPPQQNPMQTGQPPQQNSQLDRLINTWGLKMKQYTFAGDRSLALTASISAGQRPQTIIGFLNLNPDCFDKDNVITATLNQVRVLFAGVLEELPTDPNAGAIKRTPIVQTTTRGNSWSVSSPYELMMFDATRLMENFRDGLEPVAMGYMITGPLSSAFPGGINIQVPTGAEDPNEPQTRPKTITGLTKGSEDCAVAVFSDVDFISDMLAYSNFFFGKTPVGDNANLLMNTIEDLSGSADLISIRSRGNFRRPFTRVDDIEAQAELESAEEVAKINAEIAGYQAQLQQILGSIKQGEEAIIGSTIVASQKEIDLKIRLAQKQLQEVKKNRREKIEHLGNSLREINTLAAPLAILLVAIVLGIRRSVRKRHYISHASDA
jgi:ABC-type uncharacterized transport system involved in gliding motility auxiliary subunit